MFPAFAPPPKDHLNGRDEVHRGAEPEEFWEAFRNAFGRFQSLPTPNSPHLQIHFRIEIGRLPQSRLAEPASRNKVQRPCCRKNEAGQAVLIGPRNAALTASALRFSGTTQIIFLAAQSAGIVSVKAYWGTAAISRKCPSPTCCCRHRSSSFTSFTVNGSSKSATAGSLKARWPFSPMPRQQRSTDSARTSREYRSHSLIGSSASPSR